MEVTRRDLLTLMAVAASSQFITGRGLAQELMPDALTDFQSLGNVTLLHVTDTHAALLPVHYREPDSLYGVGDEAGHSPFITGEALLNHYGFAAGSLEAHAFTPIDFVDLAQKFGRFGGYAQIATLVKQIRDERQGRVLVLDGGDTLHGSATALWTRGRDMLEVINLLGVDIFTAHWEFTYGSDTVREYFGDLEGGGLFNGQFLAQNVRDSEWYDDAFKPYVVREMGGARIGVIGQAFPYVPISHPLRLVEDLTFGIQEERLQRFVNEMRTQHEVDAVVLLSHNGFSADYKLAGQVSGIDVILGGHTHDAIPVAMPVGDTLVIQSGAHGKFLGRLDLDVGDGRVRDWRFKLIPVLADHVEPDQDMANLIKSIREPYSEKLGEVLAVSESLLWRRGNFNGPFDEVILDALMQHYDAEVAFSPGFRWGTSIIPGQEITTEDVFTHTGLTYPNTWSREMTGAEIKHVMEDVANNLFHPDPYARQGGDMVRVGGLNYVIDPTQEMGQRIREMTLHGDPMEADKSYKVAGWAAMDEADGPPVYDIVSDYLRREGTVRIEDRNRVRLIG